MGWYDYGARFYDPELARFHTIDPLAEQFGHQSPFVYANNNPIRYIDFMGMNAEDTNEDEDEEAKRRAEQEAQRQRQQEMLATIVRLQEEGKVTYYDSVDEYLEANAASGSWLSSMIPGYDFCSESSASLNSGNYFYAAGWLLLATADVMMLGAGSKVRAAKSGVQFTKSSLSHGRKMHGFYKAGLHNPAKGLYKEFTGIKGIRPDFVDFNTRTIYELKPNNPRQIREGIKQLEKYKLMFEKQYGGTWKIALETY